MKHIMLWSMVIYTSCSYWYASERSLVLPIGHDVSINTPLLPHAPSVEVTKDIKQSWYAKVWTAICCSSSISIDDEDISNLECPICFEVMDNPYERCAPCKQSRQHMFHKKCMSTWYRYKRNCPTCRSNVYTMFVS